METRIDEEEALALRHGSRQRLVERAAQEQQQIARGGDSREGALAQARRDDVRDDARNERGEVRLVAEDRGGGRRAAPPERRRPDDHLVEHAAERPDVAALVGQSVLDLLGREISRRPDHFACAREDIAVAHVGPPLGDSEVDQDDRARRSSGASSTA